MPIPLDNNSENDHNSISSNSSSRQAVELSPMGLTTSRSSSPCPMATRDEQLTLDHQETPQYSYSHPTNENKNDSSAAVVSLSSPLEQPTVEVEETTTRSPAYSASAYSSGSSSTLFWLAVWMLLGLLNNAPYVVMLAAAKTISEGGVGLVFLANIVPGLLVKITLPYWMDYLSYHRRLQGAALSMMIAFGLVAVFSTRANDNNKLRGELLGVACISFQCSLGEASLLALAGKLDTSRVGRESEQGNDATSNTHTASGKWLTAFSSGTGLAGPVGYALVIVTESLGKSLSSLCAVAAAVGPLLYYGLVAGSGLLDQVDDNNGNANSNNTHRNGNSFVPLAQQEGGGETLAPISSTNQSAILEQGQIRDDSNGILSSYAQRQRRGEFTALQDTEDDENGNDSSNNNDPDEIFCDEPEAVEITTLHELSFRRRFWLVVSLWPYIIPLFTVYAAEYACQGGVWSSMATSRRQVDLVLSRETFYERSNWLYQAGVFLSRSSGNCFVLSHTWLWILPGLQVVNLILFYHIANQSLSSFNSQLEDWLYQDSVLYPLALWTGLLGGAVYVHGYQRILRDYQDAPPGLSEFALAATSMAESFGVLVANVASLFLQSCLYKANDLDGALVACPW